MKLILMLTTYAVVASGCPFLDRKPPHNHNHQPHLNVSHVSHIQQFEGQNKTNNKSPPLLRADDDLINQIREDLRKFMEDFFPDEKNRTEKLATIVRLGFHSCVGGGGCHGCLNVEDPGNRLLEDVYSPLYTIWLNLKYKDQVSRADFLAAAANFGIEETVKNNNEGCQGEDCIPEPNFEYFFGRKDSDSCLNEPDIMPVSHLDYAGMTGFFREKFNMEPKEVVALMGVHTLGRASLNNSGFDGEWMAMKDDDDENVRFNNKYYKQIIDPNVVWKQKKDKGTFKERDFFPYTDKQFPFWFKAEGEIGEDGNPHGDGFRIISDISLYRELQVNPNENDTQVATCSTAELEDVEGKHGDFQDCPPQKETADLFEEFAGSNEKFMEEFKKAFTKMLKRGYNG